MFLIIKNTFIRSFQVKEEYLTKIPFFNNNFDFDNNVWNNNNFDTPNEINNDDLKKIVKKT